MTAQPLRAGLIVDDPRTPAFASEWLALVEGGEAVVAALIVQGRVDQPTPGLVERVRGVTLRAIFAIERFCLRDGKRWRTAEARNDAGFQAVLRVSHVGSSRESGFEYSEEALDAIRRMKLDVLVHIGSGSLRGDVLSVCPFGVLSIRYGDDARRPAGLEGFWETYEGAPATGFVIQQLTHDADGGTVLLSGNLVTRRYATRNREQIVSRSGVYLAQIVNHLATTRQLPRAERAIQSATGPVLTPSFWSQVRYAARTVQRLAAAAVRRTIVDSREEWSVAFARRTWDTIDRASAQEIPNPSGHFLADPFVVQRDGRTVCFLEDFDYLYDRGSIVAYDLTDGVPVRLGTAIAETSHLSFPFVFEVDGTLYMCPETHETRDIRVYESTEFPLEWKLSAVLMKDVSAVDTIVFPSGGEWWLLSTIDPAGGIANDSLQAFRADHPLSLDWTRHSGNPIRLEAAFVRSGGIIIDDDRILRVGQNPGYAQYGSSVSVLEIRELTADSFEEVELCQLRPDFKPGIDGTHHLHSDGEWTVFDYRRTRHVWFPNLRN